MTADRDPSNREIADAFTLLGDLLTIEGAERHRVRAYHRGAERIRDTRESVAALARAGRATGLPDIGKTLQSKIVELADTGTIAALERVKERVPAGLVELAHIMVGTRVVGLLATLALMRGHLTGGGPGQLAAAALRAGGSGLYHRTEGECYEALGDTLNALKSYERFCAAAPASDCRMARRFGRCSRMPASKMSQWKASA